jgi:single-strand DNA-binding protein
MSDSLSITGTLLEIFPEQQFPSGFSKREFVVQTGDRYPQPIKFELLKERCSRLDEFEVGDPVRVNFDLRGNAYDGRYFVNLVCWKLSPMDEAADGPYTRGGSGQPAGSSAPRNGFETGVDDDDDVPY